MKKNRRAIITGFIAALVFFTQISGAEAGDVENVSYVERGFIRILTAPFQIPRYLVSKTLNEPIGLGTIDGALTGTFYAVSELSGGLFDIVRGTVPYAKYLVFFI